VALGPPIVLPKSESNKEKKQKLNPFSECRVNMSMTNKEEKQFERVKSISLAAVCILPIPLSLFPPGKQ